MPLEFQLPKCLATTLQTMYPTLHIDPGQYNDCISWYIGLPAPYSLGSQLAMTMSRNKSIHIYIREEEYEPCTRHFFRTCVHELVHALQIRQAPAGGRGAGIFNFFSFNYLTCYVRTISDEDRDNRYEREAYDHEDVVDDALTQTGGELPCACSATMPVASPNPAFKGVSALAKIHPSVIMKEATQTGPCNALVMSFGLGSLNRSAPFWQSREFFDLLGWLLLSLAGWLFGIPLPFGVLGGLALGILDVGTGIPSGILLFGVLIFGAILDGIISGIRAITEAFWPGDHPLKLIFSADDGLTFDNEGIVGITSAPPALAFGSS